MLYRLKEKFKRIWFNRNCKAILDTPPISPRQGRLAIQILTSHLDMIMAILAVKSLYYFLGEGEIFILNDGSLTSKDIDLLEYHLSPTQVVPISNISTGKCPKGNCWERFVFTADLVKEKYVFQIDSDTLTINSIPEIIKCIDDNRVFAPQGNRGSVITPMKDICRCAQKISSNHVVVVAEKNFDKLKGFEKLNYLKGCAGYTGFGKGSFTKEEVENFSVNMENIIGAKWKEWGSEQVVSNYIIANIPGATVLPYDKYALFGPGIDYEKASYLHFIGTYRFKEGKYIEIAKQIIEKLKSQSS